MTDYFTFLQQHLLSVEPRIEASLEGVWRQEEAYTFDIFGREERLQTEDYWGEFEQEHYWEFGNGHAAESYDCAFCHEDARGCCHNCRQAPPHRHPYHFDPRTGMLFCAGFSCPGGLRVEQLTADTLMLLSIERIGRGELTRCRFERLRGRVIGE